MPYAGIRRIFVPLVRRKIRTIAGVEHLPTQPPFIVAANHSGYLDGAALVVIMLDRFTLPVYFLARQEIWKVVGSYIAYHLFGMVPIRNDQKRGALDDVHAMIRRGNVIGIFPEGTRNVNVETLLKGKTGAVRLALASRVPVIPVGIRNTTGQFFGDALKSLWHREAYIDVRFGPAVDFSDWHEKPVDKPLLEAATARLMCAIGSLCNKKYPY